MTTPQVQPLSITSAAHPMAISAYAMIAVFGLTYLTGAVKSPRMTALITSPGVSWWSLAVFLAATAALVAVLVTPRLRVPLRPVQVEQVACAALVPLLGFYVAVLIAVPLWGSVLLVGAITIGSLARAVQARKDIRSLRTARRGPTRPANPPVMGDSQED